jgi:hypothetical protein
VRKPLFPNIPDLTSLKSLLEMGYAITPTGAAWPSNAGWQKPDGSKFPFPALVFKIDSQWRPNGASHD